MPWPLSQDYNEAIQNPAQCFADPELRQGEAETNELGLPAPRSGNFADVYAVASGANKWAVKCFTRQIPGLQERYQQISLHLAQYKPSFMVDFSFLQQGIRVRGEWYPILKMQWVEGATLNQFVKSNLHKPQLLDVLCQLWVKLSVRLRRVNIAHCDLQHGNVLMVPGSKAKELQVKLVDYDGMCVPALTLLKSIEVGHPAYQHPQRQREGIYNLEVDRFSHLVIFTALKALTIGGKDLWEKYDDGDNLLFKPADFVAPTKSRLLYELLKSGNAEVAGLARVLVEAATEPLDRAPLLESFANGNGTTAIQATAPARKSPGILQAAKAPAAEGAATPRRGWKWPVVASALASIAGLVAGVLFFVLRDREPSDTSPVLAQRPPAKTRPEMSTKGPSPTRPGGEPDLKNPPPKTAPALGTKVETPNRDPVQEPSPNVAANTNPEPRPKVGPPPNLNDPPVPVKIRPDNRSNPSNIDLLKLVSLDQDVTQGQWTFLGSALVSPMVLQNHRLRVPYIPPDEYNLDIVAERREGNGCLSFGLVAGRRQFVAQIDAWPPQGYRSGIQLVDGKNIIDQPAAKRGRLLHPGTPTPILILVRKDIILLDVGHQQICTFKGDFARLSLEDGWGIPNKDTLFVGTNQSSFAITKLNVIPLSGPGKLLRPPSASPPQVAKVKPMEPSPRPPQKSPPQPAPAAQANGPRPVPGEAELATALDKVKEQYKDEWSARKTKDLEDLATRLFRQGQKTSGDPALQFVLLREARDKAADAPDAELVMQVVDEMGKDFTLNVLEEKAAALERADHAAVAGASIKSVVDTTLDVVKQAAGDDNYDIAVRLLKAATLSAARSGNPAIRSSVRACSDEVHSLQKEYEKVKIDLDRLAVNPGDPAANLAVGRYCCFRKKDWDKGLPYLARGSDPQLADLANRELKESTSPAAWAKLGDGWRKFAAKADGPAKTQARKKAYAWYARAYAEAPEAEAARLEKAMTALADKVPGLRRPWEGLDVSQAIDKKTYLVLEPGKSISTRRQYTGPLLISATVLTDHHSLTIRAFGDGFLEFRENALQNMLQLSLPDPDPQKRLNNTMNYGARSPFVPLARHVVQWRITESGMEVLIDGRAVFNVPRELNLSRRGPIVIMSREGTVELQSLHVTSLK
jgi:hypothetical protein